MPLIDQCWNANCRTVVPGRASRADYGTVWNVDKSKNKTTNGDNDTAERGQDEEKLTMNDLFQMSRKDTLRFVKDNFWNTIFGDEISKVAPEVAAFLFHTSLHHGPHAALQMVYRALDINKDSLTSSSTKHLSHSKQTLPSTTNNKNTADNGTGSIDPARLMQLIGRSPELLDRLRHERESIYRKRIQEDPQQLIFASQWLQTVADGVHQAQVVAEQSKSLLSSNSISNSISNNDGNLPVNGIDFAYNFAKLGNIKGLYKKHGLISCIFDGDHQTSRQGRIFAGALLQLCGKETSSVGQYVRFSLDPWEETNPTGPFLRKVYSPPSLAGTLLGDILFEADFLLKKISMGLEPIPAALASQGLISMLEMDIPDTQKQQIFSRLWFYIANVTIHETAEGIDAFQITLAVDARRNAQSSTGKLIDVPTTDDCNEAKFAKTFTRLFHQAKAHYPILQHLEEACRCVVLVQFLKEAQLSLDEEALWRWAQSTSSDQISTVPTTTAATTSMTNSSDQKTISTSRESHKSSSNSNNTTTTTNNNNSGAKQHKPAQTGHTSEQHFSTVNPLHTYQVAALRNEHVTQTVTTKPNATHTGEVRTTRTTTRYMFGGISCELPDTIVRVSTVADVAPNTTTTTTTTNSKYVDNISTSNPDVTSVSTTGKTSQIRTGLTGILNSKNAENSNNNIHTTIRDVANNKKRANDANEEQRRLDEEQHVLAQYPAITDWLCSLQYEKPPTSLKDLIFSFNNYCHSNNVHNNDDNRMIHKRNAATPHNGISVPAAPLTVYHNTTNSFSNNVPMNHANANTNANIDNNDSSDLLLLCVSQLQTRRCEVCASTIEGLGAEATRCRYHHEQVCAFCFGALSLPPLSPHKNTSTTTSTTNRTNIPHDNNNNNDGSTKTAVTKTIIDDARHTTRRVTTIPFITSPVFGYSQKAHAGCFCCFACNQPIAESFVTIYPHQTTSNNNKNNDNTSNNDHLAALFFHPHCPVIPQIHYPSVLYPNTWQCLYCNANTTTSKISTSSTTTNTSTSANNGSNNDSIRNDDNDDGVQNLFPQDETCRRCHRARDANIVALAKELYEESHYARALRLYTAAAAQAAANNRREHHHDVNNNNKDNNKNSSKSNYRDNSTSDTSDTVVGWSETKKLAALQANICLCHVKMRHFSEALVAINRAISYLEIFLSASAASAAAADIAHIHSTTTPTNDDARAQCQASLSRYWLKRADICMALGQWQEAKRDFLQFLAFAEMNSTSSNSNSSSKNTDKNISDKVVSDETLKIVRSRIAECDQQQLLSSPKM